MNELDVEKLRIRAAEDEPAAQFLLSQVCRKMGEFGEMLEWLERASENGVTDAYDALGRCYETGMQVPVDLNRALALYEKALAAGSPQAGFRKAELLYKSAHRDTFESHIRQLLVDAALAGYAPALRTVGYLSMQVEDERLLAMYCFRRAAMNGDPMASFNLAWCLMQGWVDGDSTAHVTHWLRAAAARQHPYAGMLLAGLPPAPPPERPLFEDQAIRLAETVPLTPHANRTAAKTIHSDLPVLVYEDVLDTVDCAHLVLAAAPLLKRADVINPSSDIGGMVSDVRTNSATHLYAGRLDLISRYIELKIVRTVGEELNRSEPLSVLRYAPGEYYKPHVDFFNPRLNISKGLLNDGGQRTGSAVTCLVTPETGGDTSFPRLGVSVPAKAGNTVWFRNCDTDGNPDERSLHAGEAVDRGEKWVVTKWFREQNTAYASPVLDALATESDE